MGKVGSTAETCCVTGIALAAVLRAAAGGKGEDLEQETAADEGEVLSPGLFIRGG